MKGIIYEAYGIYPPVIENNQFSYNKQYYFIFFTEKQEEQIKELAEISQEINNYFLNRAGIIIPNKEGKYTTYCMGKNLILINLNPSEIKIDDLIQFHFIFKDKLKSNKIKIDNLITIWENRYDFTEKEIVPAIRADFAEYSLVLETVFYSFGLAENALQYLADIKEDMKNPEIESTVCHLRLPSFDYFNLFNPLNYYIDNQCRDIAELYKNGLIDLRNLELMINIYNFSQIDASLLMARVLYPTALLDLLEDFYIQKIDIRRKIIEYNSKISQELTKIKNIHILLINKYNIRPIKWLLD